MKWLYHPDTVLTAADLEILAQLADLIRGRFLESMASASVYAAC
jgi:transcription initiation factor TFIIIB Brf1 subunit/transcription initiation factor TFIIB